VTIRGQGLLVWVLLLIVFYQSVIPCRCAGRGPLSESCGRVITWHEAHCHISAADCGNSVAPGQPADVDSQCDRDQREFVALVRATDESPASHSESQCTCLAKGILAGGLSKRITSENGAEESLWGLSACFKGKWAEEGEGRVPPFVASLTQLPQFSRGIRLQV